MLVEEIYQMLVNEVEGSTGLTEFTLNGLSIRMTSRDSIGFLLQDWLEAWFIEKGINYSTLENTQEFPDFIIHNIDFYENLEIKSWNYLEGPAFDLANFESYIDMIHNDPYKLFAKYFVFGYILDADGYLTIEKIYLKNIWELTGPARLRPLTVQAKRGMIYNIRPKNFRNVNVELFRGPLEFLQAIKNTMEEYNSEKDMVTWYDDIVRELNLFI